MSEPLTKPWPGVPMPEPTCRPCIDEGTATGGPCQEPRHQAAEAPRRRFTDAQMTALAAAIERFDRDLASVGLGVDALTGTVNGAFDGGYFEVGERADDAPTVITAADAERAEDVTVEWLCRQGRTTVQHPDEASARQHVAEVAGCQILRRVTTTTVIEETL
jgi:hypothetical protein